MVVRVSDVRHVCGVRVRKTSPRLSSKSSSPSSVIRSEINSWGLLGSVSVLGLVVWHDSALTHKHTTRAELQV